MPLKTESARAIGLPNSQTFELASQIPYQPMPSLTLEGALAQAYQHRGDYQAALAEVAAAEAQRSAAQAERLPTISFNANWGDIGTEPADAHETYQIAGTLRIPIFKAGACAAKLRQQMPACARRKTNSPT